MFPEGNSQLTLQMKTKLGTALLLALPVMLALAGDIKGFTGKWAVDMDRTMEEVKKSPKFAKDGPPPQSFNDMLAKMKISLSETNFALARGTREESLPFVVESATPTNAVLAVKMGQREARLTLTLVDKKYLNVKSSVSDDLTYYIWKKSE